jgi:hypothetical protein
MNAHAGVAGDGDTETVEMVVRFTFRVLDEDGEITPASRKVA